MPDVSVPTPTLPHMQADWQETATAISTVAVAIAAIGVALYGKWRADLRMKNEREHAAEILAQERAAADSRLMQQMAHSDAQLREERLRAQDAEQQASAWAVEVVPNLAGGTSDGTSQLAVTVRNLGSYSIMQVEAQFSPDDKQRAGRCRGTTAASCRPCRRRTAAAPGGRGPDAKMI